MRYLLSKRMISLMLSLVFIIGLLNLPLMTSFAETTTAESTTEETTTKAPAVIINKAGTEAALFNALSKEGVIQLSKNILLTKCFIIEKGKKVTLDLNGYTLDRGLRECQDIGSVIRVEPGAELLIKDSSNKNAGLITGGASWNGGGICNHGTLTIEGGTIKGNKALHSTHGGGAGIYNGSYQGSTATLTIRGGVIEENQARNGAGIYNGTGSTVNIEQGEYKVTELSQLKTYYTNIKITNNRAAANGSGIYNAGTLNIKDSPSIRGNLNNDDVYLAYGKVITCTGRITPFDKIGVRAEGSDMTITSGYSSYHSKDPTAIFRSAVTGPVLKMTGEKGEVMLRTSTKTLIELYEGSNRGDINKSTMKKREEYDSPQDAWDRAISLATKSNRLHITLGSDWEHDNELIVSEDLYISLDLNGHYIKRTRNHQQTDNGGVFRIKHMATLVVSDSNPGSKGYDGIKGGVITGGASENSAGGFTVEEKGSLYMHGGTLYECTTCAHGGGINCGKNSIVDIKNSKIYFCQTVSSFDNCHGGGIYAKDVATLAVHNSVIQDCYSEDNGGGIYYRGTYNSFLKLGNNRFIGNKCNDDGGALYMSIADEEGGYADKCLFSGNKAGDDGGCIYVTENNDKGFNKSTIMFRESTFINNECGDNGSVLFVDRDNVVLISDTITNNYAGDKGAVWLSHHNNGQFGYDISVKGLMIIKDNTCKSGEHNDVVLDNYGATHNYIWCAGLYDGSYISFSVNDNGKNDAIKEVNEYQLRYFHNEKGDIKFKQEKEIDVPFATASIFSNGSVVAVVCIASVAVLGIAAVAIFRKKKGVTDNEDADE